MTIEKKVWPEYFDAIQNGNKTFELRLHDFECAQGDTLRLCEWDPKTKQYTGREIQKTVGYVLNTKDQPFFTADEVNEHGFMIISLK